MTSRREVSIDGILELIAEERGHDNVRAHNKDRVTLSKHAIAALMLAAFEAGERVATKRNAK